MLVSTTLTGNNAAIIGEALASVVNWVDRCLVIDTGVTDDSLAIARAILRNPPVLILDEATSALDYQSERLIQEALDRLAAGRTVITIAHRLSTIRNASRIIVLEAGRIIEEGDFRTLVARGGPFARMVATQNTGDDFLQL